jgi:hypothetical protein
VIVCQPCFCLYKKDQKYKFIFFKLEIRLRHRG